MTATLRPPYDQLTEREHEVLRLVARGMTTREIAAHLDISIGTVKAHVRMVLAKLGAATRAEAAAMAARDGAL